MTTRGFTLIETMVAITILTVAIAGAFFTANSSLIAAEIARDQLTASYLAQEGIEYVRMMRDDEYLAAYSNGTSSGGSGSQTFGYTGSQQTWTVPAGITSINVDVAGAQGGNSENGTQGGLGGRVQATIAVTPNETLYINVGGQGTALTGGWNGGGNGGYSNTSGGRAGGGGGVSDIRQNGTALSNRVVVAGGGGGDSCYDGYGGGGGGGYSSGSNGANGSGGVTGGSGGAQSSGGVGGTGISQNGSNGSLGVGGKGGDASYPDPYYGGSSYYGGGGGGGGYYGGGGGGGGNGGYCGGGGGGGSSWTSGSNTTYTSGYQSGNGQIIISWGSGSGSSANISTTAWNNFLTGSDSASITQCRATTCMLDPSRSMGSGSGSSLQPCSGSACTPLYLASTGVYNEQSSGTKTSFTRTVQAFTISASDERIVSKVSWSFHNIPYSVTITDHLTPWQ